MKVQRLPLTTVILGITWEATRTVGCGVTVTRTAAVGTAGAAAKVFMEASVEQAAGVGMRQVEVPAAEEEVAELALSEAPVVRAVRAAALMA